MDQHRQPDRRQRGVQDMQRALVEEIRETREQHRRFGRLLEVILSGLHEIDELGSIEEQRHLIAHEAERLLEGHRRLADRLERTHEALEKVSSDSDRLSDELQRISQLSLTDELTGLPNRREFQQKLEAELGRVARYGYPLCLAMVDLDKFKAINDTYGHPVGDRVLVTYAGEVFSQFRRHDTVARYGGEEFEVLLPNTGLEGTLRALEKIRLRAAEVRLQHEELDIGLPTFSAGVALYRPGESADDFVARADAALYEAKRLGRNRVELAADQSLGRPIHGEVYESMGLGEDGAGTAGLPRAEP